LSYKIDYSLIGGCVDSQLGVVRQVHISGSIQCTSLLEVESSFFMYVRVIWLNFLCEIECKRWFDMFMCCLRYLIYWIF